MKKTLNAAIIVIIGLFALSIGKDQVIKTIVTVTATELTGAPVHIDYFYLSTLGRQVRISGFKMYNPKGFSNGILLDLPKVSVKYDLGALFHGKIHLVSSEIDLKEMDLEKNSQCELNVDALKVVKQGEKQEGGSSGRMSMDIDRLDLGIAKIISKDYSAGKEPVIKVYDINIHKSYRNIRSGRQLVALILTEPMKSAGIEGAKIYGVSALVGVAILPVAIAARFTGNDSIQQDFSATFDRAYEVSLGVLKRMGKVTSEDKPSGIIRANIDAAKVRLKIQKKGGSKIQIIVSARKYLFPRPEMAGGVLYEITEKLK